MAPATEGGSNGNGPMWRIPGSGARAASAARRRPAVDEAPPAAEAVSERRSLPRLLDSTGTMPVTPALIMLDDVLESLGRLHGAGITHGHVRLESVVVDHDGRCRLDDAAASPSFGSAGHGLLGYVAPEVRAGGERSPASDIYAAAAVFFQALTGLPPLGGVEQARRDQAVPLPARSLLEEALDPDPGRRPATTERMRRDLGIAGDAFMEEGWRESGRAWLLAASQTAAAVASVATVPSRHLTGRRAQTALPVEPVTAAQPSDDLAATAAPVVATAGGDGFLARLRRRELSLPAFDGTGRRDPRLLAGIALIAAALLVLIVVAAVALRGTPARRPAPIDNVTTPAPSVLATPSAPVFNSTNVPPPTPAAATPSPAPTPTPTAAPTPRPSNRAPTFAPQPMIIPPTPRPTTCLLIICT